MSNLSKTLERFKTDIKALSDLKIARKDAKTEYNTKRRELKNLLKQGNEEAIKALGKTKVDTLIAELKAKQNDYRVKNNEYADAILTMQNDFEETYSTVLHSLVDTVYDARRMMHYLSTAKDHNDSSFVEDKQAIKEYLEAYTSSVTFDIPTVDRLIDEAKKLTKFLSFNERRKLMNAFARHEKEDLKNLRTFIQKKAELEETLKEVNLTEDVEQLPTTDQIIANYDFLIPQIFDTEAGEKTSMSDLLTATLLSVFPKEEAKAEVKFEYKFEIGIALPLYGDPIIVVSFDFNLSFEFKAEASATATIQGPSASIAFKATTSVTFGVSAALSLRVIQLIKASINAGIFFETSIGAEAKLESKVINLSGSIELKAESKLIAKTWISLSICGPVSAIIEAVTGKKPELRWMMGELALFQLAMEKKAELVLDPLKDEFKAEANFKPYKDGFTVEFIGKDEIKRKLNERYNNKLAVIKQQFLSNDEMKAARKEKLALLEKFDILDFDAGGNNDFKTKVKHRTSFMMRYDNYFSNFMGKIVETLHPNPEKFQEVSTFVNSYAIELKKRFHDLFIKKNKHTKNLFDGQDFKEAKEDVWLKHEPKLDRVPAEQEPQLIEKLKTALARVESNQKFASKLTALELIDLDYIQATQNIPFEEMYNIAKELRKQLEKYIDNLVIGDIGENSCVLGFSSIELFPSKRKLKHEALESLQANIDSYIQKEKGDIRALRDPLNKIKAYLDKDAQDLKDEFDQRKIDEVEQKYHKYLREEKYEEVVEYFERIKSELNLDDEDPIKKGLEKLEEFHKDNLKKQSYLQLFDKKTILEIYNGTKDFKELIKAKLAEEYKSEIKILEKLAVDIDLYDYFKKDDTQDKLRDLLDNIETLNDFIENHKGMALEKKGRIWSTTYKDYLKESPEKMAKMIQEAVEKQGAN